MNRILVVDDDESIRCLCSEILEGVGFDVASSTDGARALEVLKGSRFDLVVSDIAMPVCDGVELFVNAVWSWPYLKERFIFISGDVSGKMDVIESLNVKVLAKPFTVAEFLGCVRSSLTDVSADAPEVRGGAVSCATDRDVRFRVRAECELVHGDEIDKSVPALMVDLSRSGAKILYKGEPFALRTEFNLCKTSSLFDLDRLVSVVWSKTLQDGLSTSGVRFEETVPASSITRMLMSSQGAVSS